MEVLSSEGWLDTFLSNNLLFPPKYAGPDIFFIDNESPVQHYSFLFSLIMKNYYRSPGIREIIYYKIY